MAGLSTGNKRAPNSERGLDLYETPPVAVEALMRMEVLPERIWEPACGPGSIVRVLREAGHDVLATDVHDYGSDDQDHIGWDFLMPCDPGREIGAIVTNPPFMHAEAFVERALERAPYVAMLLRLAFLESERRTTILEYRQLARVHVFRKRLPMMHRDGWEGRKGNSGMAFAWFVWDREHSGPTELRRVSWIGK